MRAPNASSDHPAPDPPAGEAGALAPMLLKTSKRQWTRVLVGCVIGLHLLNIPAVLFRFVGPLPGTGYYVALFGVSGEGKIPTFYSCVRPWLRSGLRRARECRGVLEMAGIVVMLYALMDHLERHAPQTLFRMVD